MDKEKKKLVFIGGTVRSGTTLLNLIIANEEKALALGEIFWLFNPTRKKHDELISVLKKDRKWKRIIDGGQNNLYRNLEDAFPETKVFVDSSKDPFWIQRHVAHNSDQFDIENILVFKSPEEFAQSKLKRNEANWPKVYVNYHRRYFSLVDDFVAISYFDLINNDDRFRKVMRSVGLSENIDKRQYWSADHPYNFFGSGSIRSSNSNEIREPLRERIKYDEVDSARMCRLVEDARRKNPRIAYVYKTLSTDSRSAQSAIRYSPISLGIFRVKDRLLRFVLRCRNIYLNRAD